MAHSGKKPGGYSHLSCCFMTTWILPTSYIGYFARLATSIKKDTRNFDVYLHAKN